MRTCINCDNKVEEKEYSDRYKTCIRCLKKERFVMEIEYDNEGLGYNVLTDDNLHDLCKRFKLAKLTGFDTYIGSFTNLRIKSVEDVITREIINPGIIEDIMEEL
tara:strand:+ start:8089 stop:8403 length:315 start_codon:yes stop_codon:yes gene_type:complete